MDSYFFTKSNQTWDSEIFNEVGNWNIIIFNTIQNIVKKKHNCGNILIVTGYCQSIW